VCYAGFEFIKEGYFMEMLTINELKTLIKTGAFKDPTASKNDADEWGLTALILKDDEWIGVGYRAVHKDGLRVFKSLESLCKTVKSLGCKNFVINL